MEHVILPNEKNIKIYEITRQYDHDDSNEKKKKSKKPILVSNGKTGILLIYSMYN